MTAEKSDEEKRHDSLRRLLLRMFSADELRRFIRFMPGGQEMIHVLPGPNETPSRTAYAIVDALLEYKAITKEFFDRLVAERPRREDEIREVEWAFLGDAAGEAGGNVVPMGRNRG